MKRIATTNAPAALGPYAQAVDTGDTVYCSGQLGLHGGPFTGARGARLVGLAYPFGAQGQLAVRAHPGADGLHEPAAEAAAVPHREVHVQAVEAVGAVSGMVVGNGRFGR